MATKHITGVRVALEDGGFANIDNTTGLPTTSGLSFAKLELDGGDIAPPGDPAMVERADARSDWYELPPEPDTVWSSGARVRRRTGSFTLRLPLRTIGSASIYGGYEDMPLHMLLQSSLTSWTPAASSDTVSSAVSAVRFTPTTLARFEPGQGIHYDVAGRKEWSFVTDDPADVYHSPAFSAAAATSATVRTAQTLFFRAGTAPGDSVCCELSGDGWQSYAYGCRVSQIRIAYPPTGVYLELTVQAAYITDAVASGVVAQNPTRADGARAHFRGAYAVITGAIGTSSPAGLARTRVGLDEWTLTVDFTLTPVGHSDDIVGMANLEVSRATASLDLLLSTPSTTYDSDLWAQTQRSVLIGLGPVGAGNGAAIYLPAATEFRDPLQRDLGGDTVRQRLSLRAGLWTLDDETGADAGAPWDSPFRLALAL